MLCLGIESSCDETALALVTDGKLLDSVLASQADLHSLFGGVVPELAAREHGRFIGPLFDELMERNNLAPGQIDLVAAARGPGLLGSLLVGVGFAKGLALSLRVPFLGINHLHAHLLAVGLERKLSFPAIGLLVSGGHTHLYRIENQDAFAQLGTSLDDAAGEAFDKVGKVLGFPYPAGRQMDDSARDGNPAAIGFPRPFLDNDNMDFSFSGLKTAAASFLRQNNWEGAARSGVTPELRDFCASFNMAIAETLLVKTKRALAKNRDVRSLWLAGGVAANTMIRQKMASLAESRGLDFRTPPLSLCADNGAMIAYAGWLLAAMGYEHDLDMEAVPRGKKIPMDARRRLRS